MSKLYKLQKRTIGFFSGAILLLVFVYSMIWLAFAESLREQAIVWIKDQSVRGLKINYDSFLVSGYPFEICFDIANPYFENASGAVMWKWKSANLNLMAKIWSRDTFYFDFSGKQILTYKLMGESETYKGYLDSAVGKFTIYDGFYKSGTINFEDLKFRNLKKNNNNNKTGSDISIQKAKLILKNLSLFNSKQQTDSWNFTGSFVDVRLPWFEISPLSSRVQSVSVDARLIGKIDTGPLNKSLESWRDMGGRIEIDRFKLKHGPLKILTKGTVALDVNLQPIGTLTANLEGFFATVDALQNLGKISASNAITAKVLLSVLSRKSVNGGPSVLNTTLIAKERQLFAGPVRLMEIPQITWQ